MRRRRLSAARDRLNRRGRRSTRQIAELDARARRLRRAGADRDMPVGPDEVDAVERAVAEFERAADELVRARGDAADLDQDLTRRRALIDALSTENEEAAELLAEKQDGTTSRAREKLRVDERMSGAEYEQIRDEIPETEAATARGRERS